MARRGPRVQSIKAIKKIFHFIFPTATKMREGGERSSSFSLRSTEIEWSESVKPRFKVYLLDEGYAWVSTTRNFVEYFMFGEEKLEREAPPSLQDLRSSNDRITSGQDLKSKYSSRATCGHRNQEFSSKIRAESLGGRGFQASGSSEGFVFAPRGRERSYSGLFSI